MNPLKKTLSIVGILCLTFTFYLLAADAPKRDYIKELKQSTEKTVKEVEKKSGETVKEITKNTKQVGNDLKKGVADQKTKKPDDVKKDVKTTRQKWTESAKTAYRDLKKRFKSKDPKDKK